MKYKIVIIMAILFIFFCMPPALFAKNHGHEGHHAAPASEQIHRGYGIVEALDPNMSTVKMEHEPIASLRWPKMVMDLKVKDPELLNGLREGDRIAFDLVKTDKGFLITYIEKIQAIP